MSRVRLRIASIVSAVLALTVPAFDASPAGIGVRNGPAARFVWSGLTPGAQKGQSGGPEWLLSPRDPALQAQPKAPVVRCVPQVKYLETRPISITGGTVSEFWDNLRAKTGGHLKTEPSYTVHDTNGKIDRVEIEIVVPKVTYSGQADKPNRDLIDKALGMLNRHEDEHGKIAADALGKGACAARRKSVKRGRRILEAAECRAARKHEQLDRKEGEVRPKLEDQNIIDFEYTGVEVKYDCPKKVTLHSVSYDLAAYALFSPGARGSDGYHELRTKTLSTVDGFSPDAVLAETVTVMDVVADAVTAIDVPEPMTVEETGFLNSTNPQPQNERQVTADASALEEGVSSTIEARAPGGVSSSVELRASFAQTSDEFRIDGRVRLTATESGSGRVQGGTAHAKFEVSLTTPGPSWVYITNCRLFDKEHFINAPDYVESGDACGFRTSGKAPSMEGRILGTTLGEYLAIFELEAEAGFTRVDQLSSDDPRKPHLDEPFSIRIVIGSPGRVGPA
jgi:hypothetical protein